MATLHIYRCPECGYETEANPAGFDAVMRGMFFSFRCDHCKEIVNVPVSSFSQYWIDCPTCGERLTSNWNPIDGRCPKCGGKMEQTDLTIMAD